MTEVTRVPLQPIAKGSLTKLWLGILAALVFAAGLAWAAIPQGLELEVIEEGTGPSPQIGDAVFLNYVGKLPDGTVFDQSQPIPIPVQGIFPQTAFLPLEEQGLIPGFRDGLLQMRSGGRYTLTIPAEQAYGATPPPGSPIPPNSDLVFEVELVEVMSRADFERRLQVLEQMMTAQQGQAPQEPGTGGAEPAPPPPAQ